MGVDPEELHLPGLFLAWKAPAPPSTGRDGRPSVSCAWPTRSSAWPPGLKRSTAWLSRWGWMTRLRTTSRRSAEPGSC